MTRFEDLVKALKSLQEQAEVDPGLLQTCRLEGMAGAFWIPDVRSRRDPRVQEIVDRERIRGDRAKFRLLATSGYSYLNARGPVWQRAGLSDAVDQGAELRVVLESPFSDFAKTRALANRFPTHHWSGRVDRQALSRLCATKKVRVKVTEHAVNCSLFFTEDVAVYDPYLWGRPRDSVATENDFWVFEFQNMSKPSCSYAVLEKHFEFLWNNSESLPDFLTRNPYDDFTQVFERKMAAALGDA